MNSVAKRIAVGALSLSAAAFVGITARESYTDDAVIPTKGDVPTYGFGSTVKEDGSPVRIGDTITPVKAVRVALGHIAKDETALKRCLGEDLMLHQAEWDVYVDLAYNIGSYNFCTNKKTGGPAVIPRHLKVGDYVGACNAILEYKFAAGFDCSTPGNKRCAGVWTDRLKSHKKCMEAQ